MFVKSFRWNIDYFVILKLFLTDDCPPPPCMQNKSIFFLQECMKDFIHGEWEGYIFLTLVKDVLFLIQEWSWKQFLGSPLWES